MQIFFINIDLCAKTAKYISNKINFIFKIYCAINLAVRKEANTAVFTLLCQDNPYIVACTD